MSTPALVPTSQFVALSALRGVAALVVVQWHGKIFFGGDILPAGYLAVDFFFLLSGWVLAHAYDRRLATDLSTPGFLQLRLIRLYPVYLLALAVAIVMAALDNRLSLPLALASLVFLPDFWVSRFAWMIPPVWSLAAELTANLPFALFHRRLSGAVLGAVVILGFLGLVFTTLVFGSLDAGNWGGSWLAMFPRVFFSFFLGVMLYRHREQFTKYAPRWSAWPSMAALLILMAIPGLGHENTRDLLIVCLGLPAVLLFASNARPATRTTGVALALGAMSYPLYLLHVPLFDTTNILLLRPLTGGTLDNAPIPVVAGFLAGAIAVSLLVDRYFDIPARRWLTGRARSTPPADPAEKQSA